MIEEENGVVDDRLPKTSRGLWAASELERALKAILAFARSHRMDAWLTDEGATFMELFEAWKKEYKASLSALHAGIRICNYFFSVYPYVLCCKQLGFFFL